MNVSAEKRAHMSTSFSHLKISLNYLANSDALGSLWNCNEIQVDYELKLTELQIEIDLLHYLRFVVNLFILLSVFLSF